MKHWWRKKGDEGWVKKKKEEIEKDIEKALQRKIWEKKVKHKLEIEEKTEKCLKNGMKGRSREIKKSNWGKKKCPKQSNISLKFFLLWVRVWTRWPSKDQWNLNYVITVITVLCIFVCTATIPKDYVYEGEN